jgi:hypothetical protein
MTSIPAVAYGALALVAGTGLMVLSVRLRLRAIPGPRERAWLVRMSAVVWLLVVLALGWVWLAPRHLSPYGRYLLLPAVLAVPWFTGRMREAREQDARDAR